MAPLTGDRIGAGKRASMDGDASADAGAQDHPEDHRRVAAGAVHRLGHGETIRIVFYADRPRQCGFQIPLERLADQPCGIGVFDQTRCSGQGAGNANTDTAVPPDLPFRPEHQITNRPHRMFMDVLRCGHSFSMYLGSLGSDYDALDLGAAEINPDPEIVEHFVHRPVR